jgi:hypothetical protein
MFWPLDKIKVKTWNITYVVRVLYTWKSETLLVVVTLIHPFRKGSLKIILSGRLWTGDVDSERRHNEWIRNRPPTFLVYRNVSVSILMIMRDKLSRQISCEDARHCAVQLVTSRAHLFNTTNPCTAGRCCVHMLHMYNR